MTLRVFQFLLSVLLPYAGFSIDRDVLVFLVPAQASELVFEAIEQKHPGFPGSAVKWQRWQGAFTSNLDPHACLALLLSGETSQNNGVLDFRGCLYPEKNWLPDVFAENGYQVGILSASPSLRMIREATAENRNPTLLGSSGTQGIEWLRGVLSGDRSVLMVWDTLCSEALPLAAIEFQSALRMLWEDEAIRERLLLARWLIVGIGSPIEGERVHLLLGNWGPVAAGAEQAWVELLDLAPTLVRRLGVEIPSRIRGIDLQEVIEGRHGGHDAVYFRWWNHLGDGQTPAHAGVRTKTRRLVYYYGMDYQEREGMVEDEPSFLALMAATQTAPYWTWQCGGSGQPGEQRGCFGFESVEAVQLKHRMMQIRLSMGETDRNFPHIENLWDCGEEEFRR
jgi:hypothetical protein